MKDYKNYIIIGLLLFIIVCFCYVAASVEIVLV